MGLVMSPEVFSGTGWWLLRYVLHQELEETCVRLLAGDCYRPTAPGTYARCPGDWAPGLSLCSP